MIRLNELTHVLESGGLQAGLHFLNLRVPHRYSAIFELVDGVFLAREVVDKLHQPFPEAYRAGPFKDSFCPITVIENGFHTHDSANDSRLDGMENEGEVCSYVGLPLLRYADDLYGTLCHFDFETCVISDDEFDYLKRAAVLLPKYLLATRTVRSGYLKPSTAASSARS